MSNLQNRVCRLEQKSPKQTGVTHIVRTIVSGGHGKPVTEELHSVLRLGTRQSSSRKYTRETDEAEADFRVRAGLEETDTETSEAHGEQNE